MDSMEASIASILAIISSDRSRHHFMESPILERNSLVDTPFQQSLSSNNFAIHQDLQHSPPIKVVDLIHPKAYTKTSDEIIKTVKSLRLNASSVDINQKIDTFKSALKMARLLTMLDGRRPVPIQTSENPNGFSPRIVLAFNDASSVLEADDFFHYHSDSSRLFQLVTMFFDETLYYHCTEDIKSGNGIEVYKKIISKLMGCALRDIDIAKATLDTFRISPNKPLPAELSRLDEVILKLEHAQQSILTDTTKKNILTKLILKDPRSILHSHVAHSHRPGYTYAEFRTDFIGIYDHLPASHQLMKMASMTTEPIVAMKTLNICFAHQKGTCTRGKACKYSHDLVKEAPRDSPTLTSRVPHKEHAKSFPASNRRSQTTPFDFSNVGAAITKQVGQPSGRPSPLNPRGFSKMQQHSIKHLMEFTAPSPIQQWGESEEFLNSFRATTLDFHDEGQNKESESNDKHDMIICSPESESTQVTFVPAVPVREVFSPKHLTPFTKAPTGNMTDGAPHTVRSGKMNVLIHHLIGSLTKTKHTSGIIDSGASVCGTSVHSTLTNIRHCEGVNVQAAFGTHFQPTSKGHILDLKLDCLLIPNMTDTLISVSAACKKGNTFIFDSHGCHAYVTTSIANEIKDIEANGKEVLRGEQRGGLYHMVPIISRLPNVPAVPSHYTLHQDSSGPHGTETLLYTNAQPASKYEHVHLTLGHPGTVGMNWHRKNTPGADYTDDDANKPRGLCNGCVSGGMKQASTNHRREHRPSPTKAGQQFSLDAFTTTDTSRYGHRHADILTCLYSRIRYPVFTKNRSAAELCQQMTIMFDLHPEWISAGST